jgi:hypothetical protein
VFYTHGGISIVFTAAMAMNGHHKIIAASPNEMHVIAMKSLVAKAAAHKGKKVTNDAKSIHKGLGLSSFQKSKLQQPIVIIMSSTKMEEVWRFFLRFGGKAPFYQ